MADPILTAIRTRRPVVMCSSLTTDTLHCSELLSSPCSRCPIRVKVAPSSCSQSITLLSVVNLYPNLWDTGEEPTGQNPGFSYFKPFSRVIEGFPAEPAVAATTPGFGVNVGGDTEGFEALPQSRCISQIAPPSFPVAVLPTNPAVCAAPSGAVREVNHPAKCCQGRNPVCFPVPNPSLYKRRI